MHGLHRVLALVFSLQALYRVLAFFLSAFFVFECKDSTQSLHCHRLMRKGWGERREGEWGRRGGRGERKALVLTPYSIAGAAWWRTTRTRISYTLNKALTKSCFTATLRRATSWWTTRTPKSVSTCSTLLYQYLNTCSTLFNQYYCDEPPELQDRYL